MKAESDLLVAAMRYAAGELDPAETESFENRLGTDGSAREALAEAVRLASRAAKIVESKPDGLRKVAIAEKLFPNWFSRLLPRRPYRGHPLIWLALGGAAVGLGTRSHSPQRGETNAPIAGSNPIEATFPEVESNIARTTDEPIREIPNPMRRTVESPTRPTAPNTSPARGGLDPDPKLGNRG